MTILLLAISAALALYGALTIKHAVQAKRARTRRLNERITQALKG